MQHCVLAYKIPIAVLDGILESMSSTEREAIHWVVVSSEVLGMQSLKSIWTDRLSLAMCILPASICSTDEVVFELLCAEWPVGKASALLLTCDQKKLEGSLATLHVFEIDVHREFSDILTGATTAICMFARKIGSVTDT